MAANPLHNPSPMTDPSQPAYTNPSFTNPMYTPTDGSSNSAANRQDASTQDIPGYEPVLKPPAKAADTTADKPNPAVDLIRNKLAAIYAEEPDAKAEIAEVKHIEHSAAPRRSKHQQFMLDLNNSGKSLSQIQTEWHHYYENLPDAEKREVWQEFYNNSAHQRQAATSSISPSSAGGMQNVSSSQSVNPRPSVNPPQSVNPLYAATETGQQNSTSRQYTAAPEPTVPEPDQPAGAQPGPISNAGPAFYDSMAVRDDRQPSAVREHLRNTVSGRGKLQVKHHIQSLLFGLGFGALVILVVLFSFFNEVVVAPFIQPSRKVNATPIIVGTDSVAPSTKAEVIIPKINLEIPLDFSAKTIDESDIEKSLDNGVVHYPTTALPGQKGNAAFFGHSSNNIFNPGKYKFAFVLLHELIPGDTFYLTYNGVSYAYVVYDKKVVEPSDVSVLNPVEGQTATAVLITCDPPGTSLHRLVVWGKQISPDPNGNAVAAPTPTTSGAEQALPGNGPTLWRRILNSISGG